ncbi:hypothetical protein Egran_02113 [Elaphomyces granulatus]|uniref:Saccharopine dehydrogenase-like C-terminal domain-containing protein n=1 Tax=Elaphomyces granulatus TaxID=519963 RepID=A0A232M162_9EURO|nr:hypothetical protein Egran_02113 [Elaphomyces granulatus]
MAYEEGERDFVFLQHNFEVENQDGSRDTITSTLCEYGTPIGSSGYSAMAKLVGIPCGVGKSSSVTTIFCLSLTALNVSLPSMLLARRDTNVAYQTAVKQVLDGTISDKGILAPMNPSINKPLMRELKEKYGIECKEKSLFYYPNTTRVQPNLRRSSRGTIAANPPNLPDTQHSQEFQSNPNEYEDPEDEEFADSEVQTMIVPPANTGSSAQKQRKKNTVSQPRKCNLVSSVAPVKQLVLTLIIPPPEMFHPLTRIRKTAISIYGGRREFGKPALRWDEDAQFDEYLFTRYGTWGRELEILAAAEYFGVIIVVHQGQRPLPQLQRPAHRAFDDGAYRNMDAVNTEAPLRDDIVILFSSHHTPESSTEEPASVAPSANRRGPQNRWSRAENEHLRGMKDAGCSWDEIGQVFSGKLKSV